MALTTRAQIQQNIAAGKASLVAYGGSSSSITAVVQASGWHSLNMAWSTVGTTIGSTYVGAQLPPSPSAPLRLVNNTTIINSNAGGIWWRLYKVGSVNLSTGVFTHDSATFPVTRTQLGQATQPLSLLPIMVVKTAPATTAPIFTTTYVNQAGATITGAKTITFPSATTAANTGMMLRMEDGDTGVRDITAMSFSATGSTGAADVYLAEMIGPLVNDSLNIPSYSDSLFGGLTLRDLVPAAPTSGTLTTYLVPSLIANGAVAVQSTLLAVQDA